MYHKGYEGKSPVPQSYVIHEATLGLKRGEKRIVRKQ
jgi:hypothetical protein